MKKKKGLCNPSFIKYEIVLICTDCGRNKTKRNDLETNKALSKRNEKKRKKKKVQ